MPDPRPQSQRDAERQTWSQQDRQAHRDQVNKRVKIKRLITGGLAAAAALVTLGLGIRKRH